MKGFYFVTGSAGKFREAEAHLPGLQQLKLDLAEVQSLKPEEVIEHKIREARRMTGEECLRVKTIMVEDTSLVLECLNGLPGPLIKWFLEAVGCQGIFDIANRMGDYRATAVTVIGYMDERDQVHFFRGEVEGRIVRPRGNKNFSWDVIFQPEGYSQTFAEMSPEEKNAISHRHIALDKLSRHLGRACHGC